MRQTVRADPLAQGVDRFHKQHGYAGIACIAHGAGGVAGRERRIAHGDGHDPAAAFAALRVCPLHLPIGCGGFPVRYDWRVVEAGRMQPGVQQRGVGLGGAQRLQALGQQVVAPHQGKARQPLPSPLAELLLCRRRVLRHDGHPGPHALAWHRARWQHAAARHAHAGQDVTRLRSPFVQLCLVALHQCRRGAGRALF